MTLLHLVARIKSTHPKPTEEEAARVMAPDKVFALSCMFAEVIIDCFLCGIFTMQLASYWKWQKRDRFWTKFVVVGTTVLSYGITGYLLFFISYLFVYNFGMYKTFLETRWLSWFPLLDSLVSSFVQGFFTYRAFRLNNRSWLLVGILVTLMLTAFGGALATKIMFAQLNSELEADKVKAPMLIWLCSIMAADIIITVAILYGLLKTRTGWAHTDKVISRLIRMTFESQLPPTLLAIIFVGSFVAVPASLLGSTLQGIQSKIYGVGLMYTLNSRVNFKPQNITMDNTAGGQHWGLNKDNTATIQVDVHTDVYEQRVDYRHPYSVNRPRTDGEATMAAGVGDYGASVMADDVEKGLEQDTDSATEQVNTSAHEVTFSTSDPSTSVSKLVK